jgi:hypothetical protein
MRERLTRVRRLSKTSEGTIQPLDLPSPPQRKRHVDESQNVEGSAGEFANQRFVRCHERKAKAAGQSHIAGIVGRDGVGDRDLKRVARQVRSRHSMQSQQTELVNVLLRFSDRVP